MKLKALALLAVFAGFAALASCETMSEEACTTADWRALGMSDATNNGVDTLANRAESCARTGISVDAAAYHDGFAEGMYQFCQPERGFSFARGGGNFTGVCPSELDRDYRYAAADGRRVHELQNDLDTARSAISTAESRLRQNDEDMRDRRRALDAATTDDERDRLRRAIDQLRDERRDYNRDLRDAEDRLPRLDHEMSRLRYDIGDRWGPW